MTIITPVDSHSGPTVRCFIYTPPAGSAKRCDLLMMGSSLRVNHNKARLPCFHELKYQFFYLFLFIFCGNKRSQTASLSSVFARGHSSQCCRCNADATLLQTYKCFFFVFFPHLIAVLPVFWCTWCAANDMTFPWHDLLILEVFTAVLTRPQRH